MLVDVSKLTGRQSSSKLRDDECKTRWTSPGQSLLGYSQELELLIPPRMKTCHLSIKNEIIVIARDEAWASAHAATHSTDMKLMRHTSKELKNSCIYSQDLHPVISTWNCRSCRLYTASLSHLQDLGFSSYPSAVYDWQIRLLRLDLSAQLGNERHKLHGFVQLLEHWPWATNTTYSVSY